MPLAVGLLGALLLGYTVSSPASRMVSVGVYGALVLALALALPPHLFVALALLLVGVSTGFGSAIFSIGPAVFYISDLAVLVIVARGALPRARHEGIHALRGAPQALFVAWLVIMALAGVRALLDGVPTASVLRQDLALFYWPLLYFGFTRVLAEKSLVRPLLWRNLLIVALGFAVYMFGARALNHPFQDQVSPTFLLASARSCSGTSVLPRHSRSIRSSRSPRSLHSRARAIIACVGCWSDASASSRRS